MLPCRLARSNSGGILYAGRGTRIQHEAGYEDTVEDFYRYVKAEGSPVADETLRRFCEDSPANIDWLSDLGVVYGTAIFDEKTAYPPDGYYLYYSGNEKMPRMKAKATPAPRGHRPKVDGFGGD